jgi:hypothetical protein
MLKHVFSKIVWGDTRKAKCNRCGTEYRVGGIASNMEMRGPLNKRARLAEYERELEALYARYPDLSGYLKCFGK